MAQDKRERRMDCQSKPREEAGECTHSRSPDPVDIEDAAAILAGDALCCSRGADRGLGATQVTLLISEQCDA